MRFSRQTRLSTAIVALFSLLFMQLALASYACPGLPGNNTYAAASHHGMQGCEEEQMEQPSLCHAYQQESRQSLDKPAMPDIPPFIVGTLALVFPYSGHTALPLLLTPENRLLAHATAPPLAIRNCCFRI